MSDEEFKSMGYSHISWRRKCLLFVPLIALAVLGLGAIVMLLWNTIIPTLFTGAGTLTYWHAVGLLVLCKILFSGPRRHHGGWRGKHRRIREWKEKWMQMSDEEKAKFKEEWKNRCHDRC